MPGWNVEIVADTFTQKLAQASQRLRGEVAKEMDVVGADMVDLAKQLVPVRTGFLRDSIYHRLDESSLSLDFGAAADYALFVEMGTRRMAARPFLRAALDANQQKLLDAILVGCMNAFK